eukprot:2243906-Pleurochrysis_carterae.AAC.3
MISRSASFFHTQQLERGTRDTLGGPSPSTAEQALRAGRGRRGPMAKGRARLLIAQKNLLNINLTNKHVHLQVVNNQSGHIFLSASTKERDLKERLKSEDRSCSDRYAARLCAERLVERAKAKGVEAITFERGALRYIGKVKVIVDTWREFGLRFVQRAERAPPPRHVTHPKEFIGQHSPTGDSPTTGGGAP